MSVITPSQAEYRAAGTDLSERRRSGVSSGPIADIVPTREMTEITWMPSGGVQIGASVSIATIAADARIQAAYPGVVATAFGLATPQIRQLATLGGNLAQRSRCWYFRNPDIDCLKKGGSACPARSGNHLYSVAFDLGPCVAPHPSSMATVLHAYDATVTTNYRHGLSIETLIGVAAHRPPAHLSLRAGARRPPRRGRPHAARDQDPRAARRRQDRRRSGEGDGPQRPHDQEPGTPSGHQARCPQSHAGRAAGPASRPDPPRSASCPVLLTRRRDLN